jgi:hypothetical protein
VKDAFGAVACIGRPEFLSPSPDGFIRDNDPALQQQFLDQPQAKGKSEIQPDRMGDDLLREAVVL